MGSEPHVLEQYEAAQHGSVTVSRRTSSHHITQSCFDPLIYGSVAHLASAWCGTKPAMRGARSSSIQLELNCSSRSSPACTRRTAKAQASQRSLRMSTQTRPGGVLRAVELGILDRLSPSKPLSGFRMYYLHSDGQGEWL